MQVVIACACAYEYALDDMRLDANSKRTRLKANSTYDSKLVTLHSVIAYKKEQSRPEERR